MLKETTGAFDGARNHDWQVSTHPESDVLPIAPRRLWWKLQPFHFRQSCWSAKKCWRQINMKMLYIHLYETLCKTRWVRLLYSCHHVIPLFCKKIWKMTQTSLLLNTKKMKHCLNYLQQLWWNTPTESEDLLKSKLCKIMGVFSFVRLNCTLNFVLASYNKNKNKNLTTSQKNQLKINMYQFSLQA